MNIHLRNFSYVFFVVCYIVQCYVHGILIILQSDDGLRTSSHRFLFMAQIIQIGGAVSVIVSYGQGGFEIILIT